MAQNAILQIVPQRTSAPDGVGDYAIHLAGKLKSNHGIDSDFLSGTPVGNEVAVEDVWTTMAVASRTQTALVDALAQAAKGRRYAAILLHVGGYGFAKRGAPIWLLGGLQEWRRKCPDQSLIGIFHELYATGPIWRSSFWLGPLQKHVARELWRLADSGLTTNTQYFRELSSWRSDGVKQLEAMPVPSNVGEPANVLVFEKRAARAVVFGRSGLETTLYRRQTQELSQAVEALEIREVVDIGARRGLLPTSICGAPVTAMGRLKAENVSRTLLDCRYGFLAYDIARLGKSTIFAAYAAHGVLPVCFGSDATASDGLVAGTHFLQAPFKTVDVTRACEMQERILTWYRSHDIVSLAARVSYLIQRRSSMEHHGASPW